MDWWFVLGAIAGVGLFEMTRVGYARWRRRREYDDRVGRDLAGLVVLLPPALQQRVYTEIVMAPPYTGERIRVAMVYDDGRPFRGNPPNVGLEFDANTGELLSVIAEGVGVGRK
ncbi:hypothetical protein [Nannocystis radixulma]|uniref:Uncharacterized protein n=1 Tax=Nannocystis radixulma TaxID=2995305 RepID=A0ABT5BJJ5_9BACT|nr:hypothetical protein [Nannocystis radixulma]MDC0674325.1 hypothetical protein [Nannocystis radixulma]